MNTFTLSWKALKSLEFLKSLKVLKKSLEMKKNLHLKLKVNLSFYLFTRDILTLNFLSSIKGIALTRSISTVTG